MNIRFKLCALWLASAFMPAHAVDLLDTYRQAQQNDAVYASARSQYEADREIEPQGLANLLPDISMEGRTQMNDTKSTSTNNSFPPPFNINTVEGRNNSNQWFIQLTQPIFNWEYIMQYQKAGFQVQQAAANLGQAEQDVIVRVAEAYFNVLAARDNLEFIRANKTAISEQLAQAKRNFEVGTATITDTNEAQARYDLAVAAEIEGINLLEIAERALEQITNLPAEQLAPLKPDVQVPPPEPNNMALWVDAAVNNNYEVRASQAAFEAAGREIEKQRAGHYPVLDAYATYLETATSQSGGGIPSATRIENDTGYVGLRLTVPLFAGGAVNSRTREAVARRERARSDLDTARRTAQFDARQAFLKVSSGVAQTQAYKQALISSQTALQSNRVGYEVGVRINIDVLNAQQQVFQTQRDLARSRYDTIVNGLKLKAAAGSLSEADVMGVNRLLAGN